MKRALIALALAAIAFAAPAYAISCQGQGARIVPYAHESITVGATAIGFTASVYAATGTMSASYALVTVETNQIRWWPDGAAPTESVGHLAAIGSVIEVCGSVAVANFRAIRTLGTNATIRVSYYKAAQQ